MFRKLLGFVVLCALPACGSATTPGDALGGGGGPTSPLTLAVSANGLFFLDGYFGSNDAQALDSLPLSGGATTTLVPSSSNPTALALDATDVYVADAKGIEKVAQAGGAVSTVVPQATLMGTPSSLTVLPGGLLAWIQPDATTATASIWVTTGSGAMPGTMSVAQGLPGPCALAADSTNLYWLDCSSGELDALPIAGLSSMPTPTVLAQSLPLSGADASGPSLVAAGGSVFWTEPSSGAITKVAASGGTPTTLAPGKGQVAASMVTDGTDVYWVAADSPTVSPNSVWKVPAAGGTVTEVLTPDQDQSAGYGPIALDAKYLYFWDNDHGTIRRLTR